jgi:hypothetical protein
MAYVPPAPPSVSGDSGSGSKFIGVPDDYTTRYGGSAPIPGTVQMRPDINPVMVGPTYETKGPNTTGALQAIASLPPETMARLQIRMARAGLIGSSTQVTVGVADDSTVTAYKELLGIANRYGMSDTDALAMLESDPKSLGRGGASGSDLLGGGSGGGPTTHTSKSTQTQDFTRMDARAIAADAYRQALGQGRVVGKQVRALEKALDAYAQAHPSVSTSTTTTGADGNSTTTGTSTGGVDSAAVQQIALQQAQASPDYAEIQASTTYFNALQQALGATANVG